MSNDGRSSKRQRTSSSPPTTTNTPNTTAPMDPPEMTVDVCAEGDVVLLVKNLAGIDKPVGIRVSSLALSITSSVFKCLLMPQDIDLPPTPAGDGPRQIPLPGDDGDAMFLLLNILHLRNDKLPSKLQPDLLFRFVTLCIRYECIVAAGRAATQWFDYLYQRSLRPFPRLSSSAAPPTPMSPTSPVFDTTTEFPLFKMIEATACLNDALYFARFTSRWILTQPLNLKPSDIAPEPHRQRLASALLARQREAHQSLRIDLDLLIEPLAETLSDDNKHFYDVAPGDELTEEDVRNGMTPTTCIVDREGATTYMSALRDAYIWPATKWPMRGNTLSSIVGTIERFRIPEYDASDECEWCLHVQDTFAKAVELVKKMHKDRLWGICLDCDKAGGVNAGECRYEHFKPGVGGVLVGGGSVGGGSVGGGSVGG